MCLFGLAYISLLGIGARNRCSASTAGPAKAAVARVSSRGAEMAYSFKLKEKEITGTPLASLDAKAWWWVEWPWQPPTLRVAANNLLSWSSQQPPLCGDVHSLLY